MICPITGLESTKEIIDENPFMVSYSNAAIGKVSMAKILFQYLSDGKYSDVKYIVAGICIQQYKKTGDFFQINQGLFEGGYNNYDYPKDFEEKAEYLLKYLYDNGGKEYQTFEIHPELNYTLAFAVNPEEFVRILEKLEDEDLIKMNDKFENEAGQIMLATLRLTKEAHQTNITQPITNNAGVKNNKDTGSYIFDVALSFAGEQREYVQEVAECLKESNVKVYYDEYDDLWGKDLYQHLDEIYSRSAKFVIIFSSKEYEKKIWTNHELKSAQERALKEKGEYILPVRFDDTKIPGIRDTVKYEDARILCPEEICDKFLKKLNGNTVVESITELKPGSNSIKEILEKKTKETKYEKIDFSIEDIHDPEMEYQLKKVFLNLEYFFESKNSDLGIGGLITKKYKDSEFNVCFEYKFLDNLVYSLKFWISYLSIEFNTSRHNKYNYFGNENLISNSLVVTWKDNSVRVVLNHEPTVLDFIEEAEFSENEFLERLWSEITNTIQSIIKNSSY
ncbi:MAG: TIR domain-containing protein [Ignavibacteria bacterium]